MSLGQKKTYTGIVRKVLYAPGSKSEHEAVMLDTGEIGGYKYIADFIHQYMTEFRCT